MIRQYALIASNGNALKLPAMTLREAETCRDKLATLGRIVYVVNFNAE